jgi:DNA (cytosine-5)-methyltransferase 1
MNHRVIDLFAGPGGWDTGIRSAGYAGELLGIEWDTDACNTGRAAGHNRLQADIAKLNPHAFAAAFPAAQAVIDGVIASPSCQGFSMAGKGRGRDDAIHLLAALEDINTEAELVDAMAVLHHDMTDDRSLLALEPLRWVLALKPQWTAWEQVPAVLPIW